MLDETVDTMTLMMASYTLDQIEQQLRNNQHVIHADALQKLQIDAGYQHQALSEGLDQVSDLEACSPQIQQQIRDFEPVTHERLTMLIAIQDLLPEGNLRSELATLNAELVHSRPAALPEAVTPIPRP